MERLTGTAATQLKKIAEIFNCDLDDQEQLKGLYTKLLGWAQAEKAERLAVLPFTPGDDCWIIERDEDSEAYDLSGYVFVAHIPGYVIVTPTLNGYNDLEYIMDDHVDETAEAGYSQLAVYLDDDAYATRKEAKSALEREKRMNKDD